MTSARFKEDTEALGRLEDEKASIEDKIRVGESLIRAYIRSMLEAYEYEQPRLELPLYREPPPKKKKEKEEDEEKAKEWDPYVDFYVENLRRAFLLEAEMRDEQSPLDYHGRTPQRIAIIDPSVEPNPKDAYIVGGKGKPPASDGTVAWLDYTKSPAERWDPDTGETSPSYQIYIHYIYVTHSERGKGYMRQLVNTLYDRFSDAAWIDFGKIMDDGVEKIFREKKAEGQVPTRGKIW